ncbi:MAG: hypothetical protein QOG65_2889 [Actinomycetota bacterium]|jgi:hypothetical protein|nr:hypothetical protein [Actinomycetota bacterium]MDQ1385510.1 hypothetical protein [Actinomycetota bacterium]
MTDHERLLVALVGDTDDAPDGPFTTAAVVAMLYEIGHERGRTPRNPLERLSA